MDYEATVSNSRVLSSNNDDDRVASVLRDIVADFYNRNVKSAQRLANIFEFSDLKHYNLLSIKDAYQNFEQVILVALSSLWDHCKDMERCKRTKLRRLQI